MSPAAGAVGPNGQWALELFGPSERVYVVATLNQALCAQGAVLTGTREMVARGARNSCCQRLEYGVADLGRGVCCRSEARP
jgi:7-keto-8-aminopelargonate synthetase-like enzyme